MPLLIDIAGQRFGRLIAVSRCDNNPFSGAAAWVCKCDCGTELLVRSRLLRLGYTKSCGCLRKNRTGARFTIDGRTSHPLYITWASMIARCKYKGDSSYHKYGGRGITVCERWRIFSNFLADMGPRPEGTSLDRIDSNGHYSPENCRWADPATQSRNRRVCRFVTYQGKTQTLAEWDREMGFTSGTISNRLRYFGEDLDKVMLIGRYPGRRGRGRKFLPL